MNGNKMTKSVWGGKTAFRNDFNKCLKADVHRAAKERGFSFFATVHNKGQWNEHRVFAFRKDGNVTKTSMLVMKSEKPDWRTMFNDFQKEMGSSEFWG